MLCLTICLLSALLVEAKSSSLSIKTTVGTVNGFINSTTPHVREFRGIPFAASPVGDLRWAPPTNSTLNSSASINATFQRASCPQIGATSISLYTQEVPQFFSTPPFDEDCLYLNVYAPSHESEERLPVLVWFHGGGFATGGIQTAYELPMQWVERTKDHIVVQVNYRLNIFGFPNAAGLDPSELNLGLLDQRLGVEWVNTNIEAFGGDPSKVVVWGQSAGAAAVDIYNFAWRADPLVSGFISDSGFASLEVSTDVQQTNFSFVASQLGCGETDAVAQLSCMRQIPQQTIEDFLFNRSLAGTQPSVSFVPVADGNIVFTPAEYNAMAAAGNFSALPMITGTNTNEGASFVTYNATNPNLTAFEIFTATTFQCPMADLVALKVESGLAPYFRYQYGGNFSNVSPLWWMGAYHSSELPLLMGTHPDFHGPSTHFEYELSATMQDLWVAFARDGAGVVARGWPEYGTNGTILQFGKDRKLTQLVSKATVDAVCS